MTDADPTWMPLLTTPPYPSYAGNMACIGASAARALALYFGTNDIPVTVQWSSTDGINYVARPFQGFWQIAEHQAASRETCPKVAGYLFANYMRPRR